MPASEDPESELSSEAAGPDQPRDDLEHWLSDLRTEPVAAPARWGDKDAGSEPGEAAGRPARSEKDVSEPSGGGRHRAAD